MTCLPTSLLSLFLPPSYFSPLPFQLLSHLSVSTKYGNIPFSFLIVMSRGRDGDEFMYMVIRGGV